MKQGEPAFVPQAESWVIRGRDLSSSLALDDRCSHLGCRYKWNQEKRLFECPCHGSEFDIDGNVKRGPASRPLARLFLTEESDQLLRISDQPPGK
ncbi:MAG: ubiquinol-cytochrome c reductase iron-sulfur subunit [Deltaproteobacteria bacterium]|nr:ubiquinol-cytochrome c reductase iron-sulfur subunit [Deltaproteobacteria bacterium]